jgi:steroid 5-alpha reductase family enzyme
MVSLENFLAIAHHLMIKVDPFRLVLMAAVSAVWGLRLTYNFYRRGGYGWPPWSGEEDYRSDKESHHVIHY